MPEKWEDNDSRGDIINKSDGTGFYLIGGILEYSFPRDWVEFDYNLNLLDYGEIEDSLSYLSTPLSLRRLSDGNYFMANASSQFSPGDYQDLEIRILDHEFNILNDTVLFYDEEMYLPVHNGMDFTDENNIWVSVFERIPTSFSGTEVFDVHIFDSEMTLKGTKTFGGDERYWLFDLTATSDVGCLIVGMVPDFDGSQLKDAYILKLMPDDIITNTKELCSNPEGQVLIFPNPFREYIKLKSPWKGLSFSLFKIEGKTIFKNRFLPVPQTTIKTSHLEPGTFYFNIYENNRIIQKGKLINQ